MNDTVVARPCWTVLAKKAEDKIALIQNEMVQARIRLESLKTSQQRIQKMYDEYRDGLTKSDAESVGMREAMNQRQFMSQLLNLMQRVKTDIIYTENAIIGIKEQLVAQEHERIKMQTLADQNAMAVQREENKKDQRRMDALGVMQFNLKPQTRTSLAAWLGTGWRGVRKHAGHLRRFPLSNGYWLTRKLSSPAMLKDNPAYCSLALAPGG